MALINYDPSFSAILNPDSIDTVFVEGNNYSKLQVGVECARLAYFCAERSAREYQRLQDALARIGLEAPSLIRDPSTGTEGFAARRSSDGLAVISIRGSNPSSVPNIITNMSFCSIPWGETGSSCHAGFSTAARAILPQVSQWITREGIDLNFLILAGHSLGAAVATLLASVVRPALLVSLGSPRVGDRSFARSCQNISIARVVNCCDVVTDSPPEMAMYTHVCDPIYIRRDCRWIEKADEQTIIRDRAKARLECLSKMAALPREFSDHAPINYVRAFFP